jgi:hypothetical protein
MSTFEVIRGVEGCCLALDDTRIAGPKPWGGGTVIHAWETAKEYKAVDVNSRHYKLFGTPERAAQLITDNCKYLSYCGQCWIRAANCDGKYSTVLEWLRGDAE